MAAVLDEPETAAAARAARVARQFVLFALVGGIGTAVHYSVLIALVELVAARPALAYVAGATCGAVTNYFLNRTHTFKSRRAHAQAATAFALIVVLGIVLNGLLMT